MHAPAPHYVPSNTTFPHIPFLYQLNSAIESIRRIILHHSSEITSDLGLIPSIIDATVESVASLRSSISRNAILCLKLLIESCERFQLSIEQMTAILSSLMNRTAVGPKFVADSAYNVISNSIDHLQFATVFTILKVRPCFVC